MSQVTRKQLITAFGRSQNRSGHLTCSLDGLYKLGVNTRCQPNSTWGSFSQTLSRTFCGIGQGTAYGTNSHASQLSKIASTFVRPNVMRTAWGRTPPVDNALISTARLRSMVVHRTYSQLSTASFPTGQSTAPTLKTYLLRLLGGATVTGLGGAYYVWTLVEEANKFKPQPPKFRQPGLTFDAMRDREETWIAKLLGQFSMAGRAVWLLLLFSPLCLLAPWCLWLDPSGSWRPTWGRLLLETLERAGPAFMKWGQWAAARPDLLPPDFCTQLESLHQNAPEHSFAYTKRILEAELTSPLEEVFETLDRAPLASGTIGQVHSGVLSERGAALLARLSPCSTSAAAGDRVAVKVRHPDVEEAITYDFAIMKGLARVASLVPSLEWLHLDEMMWQFETILCGQVDFTVESAKLEHFNHNFRMWKYVCFPRPLWAAPAALVESFEEGVPMQHYLNQGAAAQAQGAQASGELNRRLAKLGLAAVLKMMLCDNLVHADLHPGNILVRELPVAEGTLVQRLRSLAGYSSTVPQVVLVDAGMTTSMEDYDTYNLVSFFKALNGFRGLEMAQSMVAFSHMQPGHVQDRFVHRMDHLMSYFRDRAESQTWVAFNECLATCMECVRESRLHIEGNVCTVIVTSMMLAELQTRLDSDCHVMQVLDKVLLCKATAMVSPTLGEWMEWALNEEAVMIREDPGEVGGMFGSHLSQSQS